MRLKYNFIMLLIVICFLLSLAAVSAGDNQTDVISTEGDYHSFNELNESICKSETELNLTYDYKYDEDSGCSIKINKSEEFTINGNDHIIEDINGTNTLSFNSPQKVIINNLTFRNCADTLISCKSPVVFNHVRFINCSGPAESVFLNFEEQGNVTFNDCVFQMRSGNYFIINSERTALTFNNTLFNGGEFARSTIGINRGNLLVENTTFVNMTSHLGTAINYKGWNFTIKKSRFINLTAVSAGAILGKYFPKEDESSQYFPGDPFLIEGCEFINLTSINNAAAVYFDLDSGAQHFKQTFNMFNNKFTNCRSAFGGAIVNLGGILNIANSTFENNYASFEGGAIYTSWSNLNLVNVTLFNNAAEKNAGAIYFDKGELTINRSYLIGNKVVGKSADGAQAIHAHDVGLFIENSTFDNGGISVYADFASDSKIVNVTRNDDVFSLNNTNYIVSVESKGIKLNLTKNSIIVDKLPSKFNLYDYGWVSPNKTQGDNDDCWAFATAGAIESALLRTTGVLYNLSENYVQKLQMKYVPNGDLRISLTGFSYSGLGYALSWYGVLPTDIPYDDRGMAADTDFADERIHVQDAMIIFGGRNDTVDLIKWAVLKYGPVVVQISLSENNSTPEVNSTGEDIAVMEHAIHFVSIVGWDDDYTEDEDSELRGAFICKDSMRDFFDKISYDFSLLLVPDYYAIVPQNVGICYIFENPIEYHVNYQTDFTGLTGFDGNFTSYSNEFTSKYDELIGAVGTYFNESGIGYSFDVYVNGVKVHSQNGVSEFAGFRTIVLSKYIPVKKGDKFKVVFKSNALPYQAYSREHYMQGMSFVSANGQYWSDITLENRTVCLKVYTVADDTKIVDNKDISVDYTGESYFTVRVVTADGRAVGAGAVVKFTIDGKTYSVITDGDGIARIKISQLPKKYTITTTYNGKTYKNTVTVKQVLAASKITIKKKTAKKLILKAKLKINGKLVKGKKITFKFRGKKYTVKTNKNGIAKKTLKKKVIKKLKKGKKYTVKITYSKTTIKTTVKVK